MPEATESKADTLVSAPQVRGELDGYGAAPVTACKPAAAKVRSSGGAGQAKNPAEWMFDRLVRLIEDFEKGLSDDEEVGGRMVGAPGDGAFHIDDIGFWGPDLIMFYGKNQHGRPVRLIQHYMQLSVLLTALPKEKEQEAPRRIGFIWREREEEQAEPAAAEAVQEAEAHPS